MLRDWNSGSVIQKGTVSTYKSTGTFSNKICHRDICQNVENVNYTYPGRQHDSLDLFAENGRHKESRTNADLKRNLEVSTWAADHDYCRTFTRKSQLQGTLGISTSEIFLRMVTVPSISQQKMSNIGKKPEIDLFASRLSNQLPSYHSWKPDPDSIGTDAPQQK